MNPSLVLLLTTSLVVLLAEEEKKSGKISTMPLTSSSTSGGGNSGGGLTGSLNQISKSAIKIAKTSFNNASNVSSASAKVRLRRKRSLVEELENNNNSSVVHIEFWHQDTGKWSPDAVLKLNKSKSKLIIENEAGTFKIAVNSSLVLEHSQPLCLDFNLLIVSPTCKHRVALYSETKGKHFIETLERLGAQVIRRRNPLPPPISSPQATSSRERVRSISVAALSSRKLRPISEGELLHHYNDSEGHEDEQPDSPKHDLDMKSDKMRLDTSRKKLFRRKSTGSAGDIGGNFGEGGTGLSGRYLPRSASMMVKDQQSTALWYRTYGTSNEFGEESRGLSTKSTKKKQQSDMSLDSDEVSSVSNPDYDSDSEKFNSSVSGDEHSDGSHGNDEWDGLFTKKKVFSGGGRSGGSSTTAALVASRSNAKVQLSDNEKLEKFKFMLVNIEEDKDLLDPGSFGLESGDYVPCQFDDYPEEVFANDNPSTDDAKDVNYSNPEWIRKSFEDLDLDVVRTEHDERRRNSVKRQPLRSTFYRSISVRQDSVVSNENDTSTLRPPDLDLGSGKDSMLSSGRRKHRILKREKSRSPSVDDRPVIVFSDSDHGTEV